MNARLRYEQQEYDFDDGVVFFALHNQVFRIEPDPSPAAKRYDAPRAFLVLLCDPVVTRTLNPPQIRNSSQCELRHEFIPIRISRY